MYVLVSSDIKYNYNQYLDSIANPSNRKLAPLTHNSTVLYTSASTAREMSMFSYR